jgi:hypothetical protein
LQPERLFQSFGFAKVYRESDFQSATDAAISMLARSILLTFTMTGMTTTSLSNGCRETDCPRLRVSGAYGCTPSEILQPLKSLWFVILQPWILAQQLKGAGKVRLGLILPFH